jgi:hypothetical protein
MKDRNPANDDANGAMFMYFDEERQMQVLRNFIGYAQQQKVDIVSADYSSFDATVSRRMIREAFRSIGMEQLYPNFATKQLLSPWGKRSFFSGVPSGSPFTNIVDCLVNAFILEYIAIRAGSAVAYRVNGDDSVAVFDPEVGDLEIASFASELGITMNPTKQARSRDSCNFNRQYWGLEYAGPVPSLNRTVNSLAYRDKAYEAVGTTVAIECLRDIQLLLRLTYHPLRDEFMKKLLGVLGDNRILLDYRRLLTEEKYIFVRDGHPISSSKYVEFLDTTFLSEIYK